MSAKRNNRIIIGTAISIAAIATAIDHTRHRLPTPVKTEQAAQQNTGKTQASQSIEEDTSPCSMDSPCGMGAGASPCSME